MINLSDHQLLLLEDAIFLISVLLTVVIYLSTRRTDRKLRRAAYVRDYTFTLSQRSDMERMFFDIDYGHFQFTPETLGQDDELRLIRLLDFFNSLGFSWKQGVIHVKDIDETSLGYAVWRIHNNEQVRRYLQHVEVYERRIGLTSEKRVAFRHFTELAEELNTEIYQKVR